MSSFHRDNRGNPKAGDFSSFEKAPPARECKWGITFANPPYLWCPVIDNTTSVSRYSANQNTLEGPPCSRAA